MKRCPKCRRDYFDDSLLYCLDDGIALLEGPSSFDEHATAILSSDSLRSADAQQRPEIVKRSYNTSATKWALASIVVFAIVSSAAYFGYKYLYSPKTAVRSLAVLPFANTSGDKDTEFLSDGIAETLINSFTKITDLKVTARTTAFRFRGREGEPVEVGRELGVGAILTGTVLEQNDNVRVQVDLINAADGSQMWGSRYDSKLTDIVDIQQKIATDVASYLKLSSTQTQQVSKPFTQNSEAYQSYLRGRFYWNKRSDENLTRAISEFQHAADIDPSYPLAYVGLADSYLLLEEYGTRASSEVLPKAKEYVDKAIALDGSLAEAYASLGMIYSKMWQLPDAEQAFQRSIELNPNYPTAYHWYSITLRMEGKTEQAYKMSKKAVELDPMSLIIISNLTVVQRNRGESQAALDQCRTIRSLDPNFIYAHECFGAAYVRLGRFDEAIDEYRQYVSTRTDGSSVADLMTALARAGRRDDALQQLSTILKLFDQGHANALDIAHAYAAIGDSDKAFEWIDKAFARREGSLPDVGDRFDFQSIMNDPRYRTVMSRMGLESKPD